MVNRRAMWPPYECEHCKRVSGVVQSNGILKLCRSLSIVEYLLLYVYFVVSNSHSSHSALFIVGMRVVAWMSPNIEWNSNRRKINTWTCNSTQRRTKNKIRGMSYRCPITIFASRVRRSRVVRSEYLTQAIRHTNIELTTIACRCQFNLFATKTYWKLDWITWPQGQQNKMINRFLTQASPKSSAHFSRRPIGSVGKLWKILCVYIM